MEGESTDSDISQSVFASEQDSQIIAIIQHVFWHMSVKLPGPSFSVAGVRLWPRNGAKSFDPVRFCCSHGFQETVFKRHQCPSMRRSPHTLLRDVRLR
jgi:hypothetical protein